MTLTAEYLRERLHYDPETGVFTWRSRQVATRHDRMWNTRFAGTEAGGVAAKGHMWVTVDGRKYLAHRLAWLYVRGCWPAQMLDHRNRKPAANAFRNLREINASGNAANQKVRADNTSGRKGVTWRKDARKWAAQIQVRGCNMHLGYFNDRNEAAAAYLAAAHQHFGEFATDGL